MRSALLGIGVLAAVGSAYAVVSNSWLPGERISYLEGNTVAAATTTVPVPPPVTHIRTPEPVKAVYMTACIAGTPRLREKVLATISGTQINSLMIDIKDYTGTVSYVDSNVPGPKGKGCTVSDLPAFVSELHAKGIYAIARITVFQDPLYAAAHPDLAVQSYSHPGKPWTDRKGLAFIDPDFPEYWGHIVDLSKEVHSIGFDEVNFDYIRFPSDGDMSDARFALPEGVSRRMAIGSFFDHIHKELSSAGIVTSADIFGQTTINTDDLGIGQVLEDALLSFDYVAPMVYPSHFIPGFEGYDSPAAHPYEVIKTTMTRAVERAAAASTTPGKLRPWLQAFDLGADYTPAMVHAEMQAVYDSGLTGWMLWDAANRYTKEEL